MSKNRIASAPVREDPVVSEPVREEPIREKKTRTRKGVGVDQFHIPAEMIPDGIDLQWNVDTVLGQPAAQERSRMEQQGWEAVTPEMFDGRFDGMFMRKGTQGEITNGGQVLMWRPLELTLEARAEELQAARQARRAQERKMVTGQIDGINPDVFNSNHGSARSQTFLNKEHRQSMPVQDT